MRSDDALLLDMLIASRKIIRFLEGVSESEFQTNDLVQSGVIREFQVIGEAARMISDETKATYHQILWHMIAGMRNRLIHEYFDIRLEVVWDAAHNDIPPLVHQLEQLVPSDEEDESSEDPA